MGRDLKSSVMERLENLSLLVKGKICQGIIKK
jgi:hypothetical protein